MGLEDVSQKFIKSEFSNDPKVLEVVRGVSAPLEALAVYKSKKCKHLARAAPEDHTFVEKTNPLLNSGGEDCLHSVFWCVSARLLLQ